MKPVIVHTTIAGEWRVCLGFAFNIQTDHNNADSRCVADLVIPAGSSLVMASQIEHMDNMVSAHYWVAVRDYGRVAEDLESEKKRGLNRLSIEDFNQLMDELGNDRRLTP